MLHFWRQTLLSIIIPTLNEEETIDTCLNQVFSKNNVVARTWRANTDFEVIVVDGGSTDRTEGIVKNYSKVRFIKSESGRAKQMNKGVKESKGEIFLFLHSDTILPTDGLKFIKNAISEGAVWGWFNVRYNDPRPYFRLMEKKNDIWIKFTRIPFGDHAIFIRRKVFEDLGGYIDIPLMEDLDLAKRLKKISSGTIINQPVITSARRWQKKGVFKTNILMFGLYLLYNFGVSPQWLARRYPDIRSHW